MPTAFLVLNPVSGTVAADLRRQKFEQHFENAGWCYKTYTTTGKEDLPAVVQHSLSEGVDLIIVSGGDGTISGVATGMLGSSVPLGILPSGTGNMFARDLAIPFDTDRALELITNPEHCMRQIDLMLADGRAMVLNLSAGLSADIILHTERTQKSRYGFFAYVGSTIANLFGLRLQTFLMEADGKLYKFRASELMIANSSLIGLRHLPLQGTSIQPDDGRVDICIIRARTLLDWLGVLANLITFHPERNARLRCIPARSTVKIRSGRPLLIQGDGELLGKTPVEVIIRPNALNIIVPDRHENPLVERLMARITPLTNRQ